MSLGFRILPCGQRADRAQVERFATLPASVVSDVMSRMVGAGVNLRPMHSGGVLAGPAITVVARPGDNLMLHKALDVAKPGDVVVVDAGGDLTNSLMGELMAAYAEQQGLAGIVINGAIRDYSAIHANKFPIFAAGVTHRGPYRDGPGEINVPISIGGMVIRPGDLILGDDDGVVCVPIEQLDTVFSAADAKNKAELAQMQAILEGRSDRSWVDKALIERNCEGV